MNTTVEATGTAWALLVWVGRQSLRLPPNTVASVAREALKWLRKYQPQEYAVILEELR